jgi:cephalosporin hydroxylase
MAIAKPEQPPAGTIMGNPVERFDGMVGNTKHTKQEIIDAYHKLSYAAAYEENLTWQRTAWLGFPTFKMPHDLLNLTDVMWQVKPALIVECGTAAGGSALFMASYMDHYGLGRVLTIDLRPMDKAYPAHPRITYLPGRSSVDSDLVKEVGGYVEYYKATGPIMVILDSDHRAEHVAKELEAYCGFVTPGSIMVVEDTNVNGHPVLREHGPGPREAMEFKEDLRIPKMHLFSQHSWLRKQRI